MWKQLDVALSSSLGDFKQPKAFWFSAQLPVSSALFSAMKNVTGIASTLPASCKQSSSHKYISVPFKIMICCCYKCKQEFFCFDKILVSFQLL